MPFRSTVHFAHRASWLIAALAFVLGAPRAHASCGAESCPIDNSALGNRAHRASFELSFQYLDQDRLRVGTHDGDAQQVLLTGGEVRTVSHITTAKAHRYLGERWTVSATLPFIDRMHQHVAAADLPQPELREWRYSGVGDLMLTGNWVAFGATPGSPFVLGLHGGVKLPTGRRHVPSIGGEEPEPHARPGTGSVDLLAGLQMSRSVTWPTFAQGSSPTALFAGVMYNHTNHGTDGHRVGRMLEGQVGAASPLMERLTLIAQVNFRDRGKDRTSPTEAVDDHDHDPVVAPEQIAHVHAGTDDNTGGTNVFASPGLRYDLTPVLGFTGYVQLPIYQRVNGTQIVTPSQFWFGVTYRL